MSDFLGLISAVQNGGLLEVQEKFNRDIVTMRDESGKTALHFACRSGKYDIVKYLIEEGSDLDCEDNEKLRPIHYVPNTTQNNKIKKLLIESGCRLNRPQQGMDPFISNYKSNKTDEKLLRLLRSFDCTNTSKIKKMELSILLDEIVNLFHEKYHKDIFEKIKNNLDLSSCEKSKLKGLELAINILTQIDIKNSVLTLPNILVAYLENLSEGTLPNYMLTSMSRNFLKILCEISVSADFKFGEGVVATLWKYFHIFGESASIKTQSAYLLLYISKFVSDIATMDCDMLEVVKFMKKVIARNQRTQFDVINGGFIGDEKEKIVGEAIKKILRPSMNDYTEEQFLGSGRYGQVFRCYDPKIGMVFAIKKIIVPENDSTGDEVKSLENEIKIFQKLSIHKRILGYFGTTRVRERMQIFMEFMPKGSLRDSLDRSGAFSVNLVGKYTKQILEGLDFLHKNQIIHRDVKAANILKDSDDNIKLADFGISKSLQTITSSGNSQFTFIGTYNWMAPEVIKGSRYTSKIDVWSLGATVLEMLTRRPPFHDFEGMAAIFKIADGHPIEPYFPPNLRSEIQEFLKKVFVNDPLRRADVRTLLESTFIREA